MPRYYLFKKCEQRNNGSAAHSNNYGAIADIKDQASGNYVYNAIGELNYDRISSIDSIKWNVYGKIQHIYKHAATYGTAATGLHYYYDPSGNRVGRAVLYNPSTSYNSYTWYVRDAQGNVLATYRTIGSDITTSTLKLIEHHMYGSSRLGIINRDMDVDQGKPNVVETSQANLGTGYLITFTKGNKLFELTNHLGNVLVTVTDVKTPTPKSGTPSQVGGYIANMVVATDYTPFGMIMQGRNYNNAAGEKYRYGFNGKEYDNAVKGTGNEIDYGERPYDPMGGRFWSVDPITSKYPMLSPYQFAGNNPIQNIDMDGLEPFPSQQNLEKTKEILSEAMGGWVFKSNNLLRASNASTNARPTIWWQHAHGYTNNTGNIAFNKLKGVSGEAIAADIALNNFQRHISTMKILGDQFQAFNDPSDGFEYGIGGTWDYALKVQFNSFNRTIDNELPTWNLSLFFSDGTPGRMSSFDLKTPKTFLFEIKTLSPDASTSSLYLNITKGLRQAIDNGKNKDSYSILMVDQKAYINMWQNITPAQQGEIKSLFSQLTEKGGGLWLINDLESRAKKLANDTYKEIKNETKE